MSGASTAYELSALISMENGGPEHGTFWKSFLLQVLSNELMIYTVSGVLN